MKLENNLFSYGPSELTQDAFICYLLSFAMKEYEHKNMVLSNCAKELLHEMCKGHIHEGQDIYIDKIKQQYLKIDVLVGVNGMYNLIIEDKTFTNQHDEQINTYKKELEKLENRKIISVYYKIIEQPFKEKDANNLFRHDILRILNKYYEFSNDKIFRDYVEYLRWIDDRVNSFAKSEISEWNKDGFKYHGFFRHLVDQPIVKIDNNNYGWGYVSNPNGGFMGFWWYFKTSDILSNIGISENIADQIYLQIENDKIALKIKSPETYSRENINDIRKLKNELYEKFKELVNKKVRHNLPDINFDPDSFFKKTRNRTGAYMTVGHLEYDHKNYANMISIMQDTLDDIISGEYIYSKVESDERK